MKRKLFAPFSALIFSAVWLLLFLAGQSRLVRDPGTFFHTAAGEHLLETGHLIHRDFYSFTRFGEPWIAQQWLGECIMAVVHRIAGLDGLLVVTVSLIALLWSGLALRIERSGMNLVLGSLILALALAASSHHLHVRPHIVTILFMTHRLFPALRCRNRTEEHGCSALVDTGICPMGEHTRRGAGGDFHAVGSCNRLDAGPSSRVEITLVGQAEPDSPVGCRFSWFRLAPCEPIRSETSLDVDGHHGFRCRIRVDPGARLRSNPSSPGGHDIVRHHLRHS